MGNSKNDTEIYTSLKNVKYMYKMKIIPMMCHLAMPHISSLKSPFAEKIFVFYIKNLKSRIEHQSELVEFPAEFLVAMAELMRVLDRNAYSSDDVDEIKLFEECKKMLKCCGGEFTDQEISEITKPAFDTFPIRKNRKMYHEIFSVLDHVFYHFHLFYITYFLPKNLNETFKPVIRLFSHKNTYLVLANDVLGNLRKQGIDVSELEVEVRTMGPHATWNFKELAGKIDMKNIEFVKIPLDLSDAKFLIPTFDGGSITASKIFEELEEPAPIDNETRTAPIEKHPAEKNPEIEESGSVEITSNDRSSKLSTEHTFSSFSSEDSSSEDTTASTIVEPTSQSSNVAAVVITKTSISKKTQKKSKKSRKKDSPKEVQLESNSCPKCIRSSEYSRATNEKLRISKVENKHLKKNLAAVEMENIEQKEIIEMLKKKLQEKEEELQKKYTVVEVLEAEKEVMQQENQKNKEKINELEEELQTVKPTVSTISTQTMEQPTMIDDLSENAKDGLYILLNVRNTLKTENPIQKIQEVANQVFEKSYDRQTQLTTKCEVKLFERKANFYMKALESHIKWVLSQLDLPSNWDPCLPEFPGYSQKFQTAYKTILKSDPPKICETLLKAPLEELEDTECVICSDEMDSFEGTAKCENCKRRYHDGCAKKWFKVKRTCPMSNESMLDEEEFPQLS